MEVENHLEEKGHGPWAMPSTSMERMAVGQNCDTPWLTTEDAQNRLLGRSTYRGLRGPGFDPQSYVMVSAMSQHRRFGTERERERQRERERSVQKRCPSLLNAPPDCFVTPGTHLPGPSCLAVLAAPWRLLHTTIRDLQPRHPDRMVLESLGPPAQGSRDLQAGARTLKSLTVLQGPDSQGGMKWFK